MENTKMQLVDWLDDLCVRFIINLPREELESVERICFQIEEAQWFYEDFIRPLDPSLPSLSLRAFSLRIFQHCPLFAQWTEDHYSVAFAEFLAYKTRVPVRGAIMLNDAMDEVVLVKGWKKGANWSFPRGKINKDEKDLDCAVREVYEETGFDIQAAGLVPDETDVKSIEVSMREQHMRLFVFRGVPKDTHFEPRTRKEISKIEWYKLSELPTLKKTKQQGDTENLAINANKFYMVAPFLNPLKKWISQQKKTDARKTSASGHLTAQTRAADEPVTEDEPDALSGAGLATNNHFTPQAPSDLPEVTVSNPAREDASSHLKQLLKIGGPTAPVNDATPMSLQGTAARMDPAKSNALLALLKGPQQAAQRQIPPPETPIDQISHPPEVPRSPHHQHPRPPTFSSLPPPPQFPLQAGSSTTPAPSYFPLVDHPVPIQPHLPQQQPAQLPALNFSAHGPAISPDFQVRNGPNPQSTRHIAPYQRTGDPQFAQNPQFPGLHAPSIPPASNLPKLTNHTRSLLDVFKSGQSSTPKVEASVSTPTHLLEHVEPGGPSDTVRKQPVGVQPQSVTQHPPPPAQGLLGLVPQLEQKATSVSQKQRSEHADNLLNLFRRPSQPSTQSSNLLPTAAGGPAELSAIPSPSMLTDTYGPKQPSTDKLISAAAPHTVVRGGRTKQTAHEGQTAATVSGPLNLPQFEGMAKSTHRHNVNGTDRKHENDRLDQKKPLTILARPDASFASQPSQASTHARPQPVSQQLFNAEAPPKQYKILQRPTQTPEVLASPPPANREQSPASPALQALHKPAQRPLQPNFDRRESQPAAQQQALLSLFGKPAKKTSDSETAPISAISTPSVAAASPHSAIISPIVDKAPQKIDTSASVDPSRSRLGSLSSMVGSGSHTPTSSKPTSASDKAFLNDFLASATSGRR